MSKECPATGEVVLYLECLECDDKVCRTQDRPRMTNEEKEEYMMQVLQRECAKYGYKCEKKFGIVYIMSKYERWYFKPYIEGNHVKLMHQNSRVKKFEWHKQFTKRLTYVQLVRYIYEHEHAKFYPEFIPVTIITDQYKESCCRSDKKRNSIRYATI